MKKSLFIIPVILFCVFSTAHTARQSSITVTVIAGNDIISPFIVSNIQGWLYDAISLDSFWSLARSSAPDYSMTCLVNYSLERYTILVYLTNNRISNRTAMDKVFTEDIWSQDGLQSCIRVIPGRISKLIIGMKVAEFREDKDYRKIYMDSQKKDFEESTYKAGMSDTPRFFQYFGILEIPAGIYTGFNPLNIEGSFSRNTFTSYGLSILQYYAIWFLPLFYPGFGIGIGVGTELFEMRTTLNTNIYFYSNQNILNPPMYAGSVLPIKVYVPVYLYPAKNEMDRRDVMLVFKLGWSLPDYQYLDISLRYFMPSFLVTFGFIAYADTTEGSYHRPKDSCLYIELSFLVGQYLINNEPAVREQNQNEATNEQGTNG